VHLKRRFSPEYQFVLQSSFTERSQPPLLHLNLNNAFFVCPNFGDFKGSGTSLRNFD
jgi:hypothetical protein